MTAEELLAQATADFEQTFKEIRVGEARALFSHNGDKFQYFEVSGNGIKGEGERCPVYDTAEQAVSAWRAAIKEFEGKNFLYWRIRPEIERDPNEMSVWDKTVNPTFGKWRVYSRFRVLD